MNEPASASLITLPHQYADRAVAIGYGPDNHRLTSEAIGQCEWTAEVAWVYTSMFDKLSYEMHKLNDGRYAAVVSHRMGFCHKVILLADLAEAREFEEAWLNKRYPDGCPCLNCQRERAQERAARERSNR